MSAMRSDDPPATGLRERKKARTRASIQEHALRLFRAHGYDATTVEQIADAAEVSPSTFFRYFPTKEDVVLYDVLDPFLFETLRAQPRELSTIAAIRRAFHTVWDQLPAEELDKQRERGQLIFGVPELRAAMLDDIVRTSALFGSIVAERVGRPADDPAVRTFTGALIGALLGGMGPAILDASVGVEAFTRDIDRALAFLEDGLPL